MSCVIGVDAIPNFYGARIVETRITVFCDLKGPLQYVLTQREHFECE